jgi:hypothetical protein
MDGDRMAGCMRCAKRVAESKLNHSKVVHEETYLLSLCSRPCFKEWDHELWSWLVAAETSPINRTTSCFRCGQPKGNDHVSFTLDGESYYFRLCDKDSERWTKWLWSWLRLAHQETGCFGLSAPKDLDYHRQSREVVEVTVPQRIVKVCGLTFADKAEKQMAEYGITAEQVERIISNPLVTTPDRTGPGLELLVVPGWSVQVDRTDNTVLQVIKDKGYRTPAEAVSELASRFTISAHARKRLAERQITVERAFAVMLDPSRTEKSDKEKRDCRIYLDGEIGIVADLQAREIVTVYRRHEMAS